MDMAEIGKPDRTVYPKEDEFEEWELIPLPQEEPIPLPEEWPLPAEIPSTV